MTDPRIVEAAKAMLRAAGQRNKLMAVLSLAPEDAQFMAAVAILSFLKAEPSREALAGVRYTKSLARDYRAIHDAEIKHLEIEA